MPESIPFKVFHTRLQVWFVQVVLPLLFIGLAIFLIGQANLGGFGLAMIFGLIGTAIIVARRAIALSKNWLHLDAEGVHGCLNQSSVEAAWSNVLAAWRATEPKAGKRIYLGTPERVVAIPTTLLNENQVWMAVQEFAPEAAFAPVTFPDLPSYQEWADMERLEEKSQKAEKGLIVTTSRTLPIIGAVILIFSTTTIFLALTFNNLIDSLLLAGVSMLGLFLLSLAGEIELDSERFVFHRLLGQAQIDWSDVRRIESDPLGFILVLAGEHKQMLLPAPPLWNGDDSNAVYQLFLTKLEEHKLSIQVTGTAYFKLLNLSSTWKRIFKPGP